MKGLYYDGKAATYREDLPKPSAKNGESLVKIHLAAICNTDREIIRGYKPDFTGIMGHEFVGSVLDSPDKSLIGKRVVGELNSGCGNCLYCTSGRERHCKNRKVLGMAEKDGCFAELMTIDTRLLHLVPDNLPTEQAIYTEPFAAALEICQQHHIRPDDKVCIIGDGRLAFMIAQAIALTGAELTIVGRHQDKLAMFAPFAHTTTSPTDTYEIVIEASGSPSGLDTAIALVRSAGKIILKSTYAGTRDTNLSAFVVNEISISGSRCGPFAPALRLLSRQHCTLPSIQRFELSQWQEAFECKAFKSGFRISG